MRQFIRETHKCRWTFVVDVMDRYHNDKMERPEVYPVRAVTTKCVVFGASSRTQDMVPDANTAAR